MEGYGSNFSCSQVFKKNMTSFLSKYYKTSAQQRGNNHASS